MFDWTEFDKQWRSPSGRFRLDVIDQDADKNGFAAWYLLAMADTGTGEVLWSCKHVGAFPPWSACVSDAGHAVLCCPHEEDFIINTQGEIVHREGLLFLLSGDEREKYTCWCEDFTTWMQHSMPRLATVAGRDGERMDLFVMRAFWGRRIAIDLSTGQVVELGEAAYGKPCGDAWIDGLISGFKQEEAAFCRKHLVPGCFLPEKDEVDDSEPEEDLEEDDEESAVFGDGNAKDPFAGLKFELTVEERIERGHEEGDDEEREDGAPIANPAGHAATAVVVAGLEGLTEFIPVLRMLEDPAEHPVHSSLGDAPERDDLFRVQTALRRLGEQPRSEGAILLQETKRKLGRRSQRRYETKVLIPQRAANANRINPGLSAEEMVRLIGFPDCGSRPSLVGGGAEALEYDIDSEEPFTLVVHVKDDEVVHAERIVPAKWKGVERERVMY